MRVPEPVVLVRVGREPVRVQQRRAALGALRGARGVLAEEPGEHVVLLPRHARRGREPHERQLVSGSQVEHGG